MEGVVKVFGGVWDDDWKGKVCVEFGVGLGLLFVVVFKFGVYVVVIDGTFRAFFFDLFVFRYC